MSAVVSGGDSTNQKLKKLRLSYDLSQEQMGKLAGVSRSSWNCYEKGRRTPPLSIYRELSRNLNIPIQDLLEEPDDPGALVSTPEEASMLQAFRHLDGAGKEHILEEVFREQAITEYCLHQVNRSRHPSPVTPPSVSGAGPSDSDS